jgi:hypothetical protein
VHHLVLGCPATTHELGAVHEISEAQTCGDLTGPILDRNAVGGAPIQLHSRIMAQDRHAAETLWAQNTCATGSTDHFLRQADRLVCALRQTRRSMTFFRENGAPIRRTARSGIAGEDGYRPHVAVRHL